MTSTGVPYLALRVDHETRYVYISPLLSKVLGTDPAAMVGRPITEVDLPHNLSRRWDRACRKVLGTGTPTRLVCTLPASDGVQRWRFTFYPIFANDGGPSAVSVIAREASAGQQGGGRVPLVVQQYLGDALERSRDVIYRLNLRTGRYEYISQSAEAVTGFTSAALLQLDMEGFSARLHPADRGRFLKQTETLVTACQDEDEVIEYRFRHASGEYHWLSDSRTAVRDDRGVALALAGSLRDITRQQRVQSKQAWLLEALIASRERLEQVVQQMPIGVTIADAATGNLIMVNEEARRILGDSLRDTIDRIGGAIDGARHPDGCPYAPDEYPQVRSLRQGEVVKAGEVRYRRNDGADLVLSVTSAPIYDPDRRAIAAVSTFVDITERREAERQLKELNTTLERRVVERTAQLRALASELIDVEQRERRRLAQGLHDHLQQLLVAARLNATMLLKEASGDSPPEPLVQLDRLLGQSIQTSRSLAVELSPPVLYDLGLPAALHWLARWMLEKHSLIVRVEAEDADPEADSMRVLLFEAARELLFNVVKHAGVDAASVRLWQRDGHIHLCVTDEGTGFDVSPDSAPTTGTGFGLFSIRERLDSLGGGLQIESAPGRGTRVHLNVPIAPTITPASPATDPTESDVLAGRESTVDGANDGGSKIRVLLADDHAILRKGLTTILRSEPDLEIVGEAADGVEAVELARALEPDVVLMDVSMPSMDGIEATRRIRSEFSAIRVIGLSMHDEADVSAKMQDAGACGYVAKSGGAATLLAAIRGCGLARGPFVS